MSKDKAKVHRIMGAVVFLNGASTLGRAGVVTLPDMAMGQASHEALGMIGAVNFPVGFDAIEAQIEWTSWYPDIMKSIGNPYNSISLQIRGSIAPYTSAGIGAQLPAVVHITGKPVNFPLGTINPKDNPSLSSSITCSAIKLQIGGEDIYEVDVFANVFKVAGVDILADYNRNLGLT